MPATLAATAPSRESPSPPVLEIDSLSMRFGRQEVLRDLSITIPAGQTLAVLGESGCGKTVLLKTMIGLVRPTQGEVRFEGVALSRMGDRQLAHLRTRYGFVFQGAALFDSLSIADNIAFPLREHTRLAEGEIVGIVESLLAEVGLPRSAGEKKPVPRVRSATCMKPAAVSTGRAKAWRMAVMNIAQIVIGSRNIVIPGARMRMIVVM
jgi:phospholipid/cholesterol/gamma-HCH transport system ATP-binding protein